MCLIVCDYTCYPPIWAWASMQPPVTGLNRPCLWHGHIAQQQSMPASDRTHIRTVRPRYQGQPTLGTNTYMHPPLHAATGPRARRNPLSQRIGNSNCQTKYMGANQKKQGCAAAHTTHTRHKEWQRRGSGDRNGKTDGPVKKTDKAKKGQPLLTKQAYNDMKVCVEEQQLC
jgi:hypothetical protein